MTRRCATMPPQDRMPAPCCGISSSATGVFRVKHLLYGIRKSVLNKPFSLACERNREPILAVLSGVLQSHRSLLEIGSGSGQHAVYFGGALPHLRWQTSDLPENHGGIRAWINEAGLTNVLVPVALDMTEPVWPMDVFDAVFTANTCHIMAWREVETMLAGVGALLRPGGVFCIYGPFNYQGAYTSAGNAQFDAALKAGLPHRGIRDIEALLLLAKNNGFRLQADHAMPANNRLLVLLRLPG